MLDIIIAAAWPIYPLILASIVAIAIMVERAWTLRSELIAPSNLLPEVKKWLAQGGVTQETCDKLKAHSLLGEIFASALSNVTSSREIIKESIEEVDTLLKNVDSPLNVAKLQDLRLEFKKGIIDVTSHSSSFSSLASSNSDPDKDFNEIQNDLDLLGFNFDYIKKLF